MRKPWLLNLLLLAALAVAAARFSRFLQEPLPALPVPAPAAEAPPAGGAVPEGDGVAAPDGDDGADGEAAGAGFDVIIARDLFSPTRGVVPPKPPAAADARPVAKPAPPPKMTLYGVVIVEGERAAYLQEGTGDAKPRRVREGESIAGATVKAIRPDGVTLTWAGGEISLALRAPKDGAGAATPPGGGQSAQPAQSGAFPRRFPQQSPAVAQPGRPVPGVPRLLPPAIEEEEIEEEILGEDDEDLLDGEDENFEDDEEELPEEE